MEDFKKFIGQYRGAIIGIIVAIVILAGALIGNYIQQNKDDVKTKLKKFIDRM